MLSRALRYLGPVVLLGLVFLLGFLIFTYGGAFSLGQWATAIAIVFVVALVLLSM
jgi:hypothetical protein